MSPRRSRFQISVEVLTAISNGEQKPTRIMYSCNLSWNSIKETLDLLSAKGFVDEMIEDGKRKRYCISARGRDVLGYYSGLQDLVQVSVG